MRAQGLIVGSVLKNTRASRGGLDSGVPRGSSPQPPKGSENKEHSIDSQAVILPHRLFRVPECPGRRNEFEQARFSTAQDPFVGRKRRNIQTARAEQEDGPRHMKGTGYEQ